MMGVLVALAAVGGLIALLAWLSSRRNKALLESVRLVELTGIPSVHLEGSHSAIVFLPPGYTRDDNRQYPVLYVNDGQEWQALKLRETLARLTNQRLIDPLIAVAIPVSNDRLQVYGTAVAPNAQGLGTQAPAYARFVTEELMPLIDARFKTRRPAAFTGVSLGGLSAFDIVWNYPKLFDAAGVFSGSFWWRAAADETAVPPGERIAHSMVCAADCRPFAGWFQAGTRDEISDRDGNGVIDAIQDTQELIDELAALGCDSSMVVEYVEVSGGRHDYATWARALPEFLCWAFSPARRPRTAPASSGYRPPQ